MARRKFSFGPSMRITAGNLKGRVITGPEGLSVRPTGSKMRQAFFNIISNNIEGARFVDVCAGSGLMGFEALSRGARSLVFIEKDKRQGLAIQQNIKRLDLLGCAEVITGDLRRVLPVLPAEDADIIFADPPYQSELATVILILVDTHDLLAADGFLAIEHALDTKLPQQSGRLANYDFRKYGQSAFSFFARG